MELLNENPSIDAPSMVPAEMKSEEVSSTLKNKKPEHPHAEIEEIEIIAFDDEKSGGTGGTFSNDAGSIGSPAENSEGTQGTFNLGAAVNPLHDADKKQLEKLSFAQLNLPCFIVRNDWFELEDSKRKSGVWYCYLTEGTEKKPPANVALRICSPLYIDKTTNTEDGKFFGRLLHFRDTLGRWRTWAMPWNCCVVRVKNCAANCWHQALKLNSAIAFILRRICNGKRQNIRLLLQPAQAGQSKAMRLCFTTEW
jgi:hypothetical protein